MIIEQKLTTGEEIRKLSRLSEEALVVNDIESLKEIRKIIDTNPEFGGIQVEDHAKWFYCMVPPEILKKI